MTATLVTDWVELIYELTRRGLSRRQIGASREGSACVSA